MKIYISVYPSGDIAVATSAIKINRNGQEPIVKTFDVSEDLIDSYFKSPDAFDINSETGEIKKK